MSHPEPSRRDLLKLLTTAPLLASAGLEAVVAAQAAVPRRTQLCLVSRHVQWAEMEEAVVVAAEAGCKGIAWTIRPGAHLVAEHVERDLPKAVALARKAGLETPMVITAVLDAQSPRAEASSTHGSLG